MATLIIEIDIKTIKKFAALANIDLTHEQEAELENSEVSLSSAEAFEYLEDPNAILMFAGIVIHKKIGDFGNEA